MAIIFRTSITYDSSDLFASEKVDETLRSTIPEVPSLVVEEVPELGTEPQLHVVDAPVSQRISSDVFDSWYVSDLAVVYRS